MCSPILTVPPVADDGALPPPDAGPPVPALPGPPRPPTDAEPPASDPPPEPDREPPPGPPPTVDVSVPPGSASPGVADRPSALSRAGTLTSRPRDVQPAASTATRAGTAHLTRPCRVMTSNVS